MARDKLIDGKYEYFAFISYRDEGEDAEMAKWLQKKLEHYKLPTFIRKDKPELPERISPIFEYKSETGNTPTVKEAIWKGLTSSKFLIVICSPRATRSKWLNDGINYFVRSGLEKNIIPFIIDGKPKADNTEECFPEELLKLNEDRELQGININVDGRDKAAVKVISRMFDVKFDTLWQRYEREQRRKRWMWIAGSILIALIGLSIGGYFVKQNGIIKSQKERLRQDSITMADHLLHISTQNDSISKQNLLILRQRNDLENTNKELRETNIQLAEEKRRVNEQYTRLVAAKAYERISDNDYLKARMMHSEILPQLEADYRFSIIPEVEPVLRKSFESNSGIINAHINSVSQALISPDGNYAVSCANYENIKIWDVHTGLLKGTIVNTDISPIIKFSPNGNLYISSDSIRVWSLNPLKIISVFNRASIKDIDKNNRILTINSIEGNGQAVVIIDGNTGNQLISFPIGNNKNFVTFASFLHGNRIATSSNDSILIWDITTKKLIKGWKAHSNGVGLMRTDSEGICLLSGEYGKLNATRGVITTDSLTLWDSDTGSIKKKYPFPFSDAIFSPDDSRIIATDGNEIIIIDVLTGRIIKTLNGHNASITQLGVDYKGQLMLSASSDGIIRLWDDVFVGPIKENDDFLISHFNEMLVGSANKRHSDANIYTVPVAFHPNGKFFLVSAVDSIMVFTTTKPEKLLKKIGKKNTPMISSIKYSKDGKRFITTDGSATIWDAYTFKPVRKINSFKPKYAEISPDGTKALTVQRGTVLVWDISKGDSVISNHIAAFTSDNNNMINMASFSPNSRHVVTANRNGTISVWNVNNNRVEKNIIAHNSNVSTAYYSPDGKHIVSSSADKTIKIWDINTGRSVKTFTLTGHMKEVCSAEYSKKGNYILSTSFDNTAILWDTKAGVSLKTIHSQGSTAAMSPNEDYILVVSSRGTFNLHPFPSLQQLIDRVKNLYK